MARAVTSCLVALVLAGTTLLLAQTPPCGTVINTTGTAVTFDSDMVCPVGFADTALTIEADDVVVDGAGYSIVAPTAIRGVYAKYASNVAIRNLASVDSEAGIFLLVLTNSEVTNVDFSGSGGTGLHVAGGSGLLIVDNTAHGRQEGIRIAGSTDGNTYRDNNLSDNAYGIVSNDSSPRTGSSYINNDISRSTNVGMWLAAETGLTLSGNNFTDAASGILFWYMDSFTFADWDFSVWNIPGVAVWMGRSTNSTIRNINASGSGGTGVGIRVVSSSGMLVADNIVHGRAEGIRIAGSTDANTYRDNDLSDNAYGIVSNDSSARTGSSYINNDVSRSSAIGMWLAAETGLTLSGNNFTDAASGIHFWYMDSFTFSDRDFSVWNIPGTAVGIGRSTNSTIRNINASGSGGTGIGISVGSSSGTLVADNIVHGRAEGIRIAGSTDANTYRDNDLSDNAYGIVSNDSSARTGSSYINNDVSRSSAIGMWLAAETGLTLSGNNFTDAASGIHFWYMDSFTFSDRDFSVWNIPGTAVGIGRSTNSTIRNIDASGSGGIGKGIRVVSSSGMLVADNIVHGRQMGIRIEGSTSGNSYTGNDLTDNAYAVSSVATPMLEAAFVDNDLSRSSLYGMVAWYGAVDPLIRGNIFSESATGVFLADGEGAVVAANEFAVTGGVGIKLSGHADAEIMNNLIIDGSGRGLEILDSPGTRVYHNNIFGQQSWQAFADDPIELSYSNEGNYWGRACPGPLFIEAEDSNALGVVDSNPYGVFDGWLVGADPGCGPPPPGSIAGEVRDNFSGVPSVVVSLTDSGGLFLRETSTGADGGYGFSEVEPGLFGVSIIVPIGYAPASATDVEATVNSDEETTVDFLLERLVLAVDTRGLGYWKHQAKANLTGRGHAHESASDLLDYLGSVQDQYDIFDHVVGLAGLLDELDPPKPATMRERAEQHLMTLLVNLASLRIATYTVISYDDTAGEAIDYILETLGDAGSNKTELEAIKDLAEDINEGRIPLDPDRIPEPLE